MYFHYNANSKGNSIEDCVVRSISLAEKSTWDKTYMKLSNLARKEGLLFSDVRFVEDYLDKRYPRIYGKGRLVKDFVKTHPKGVYLITMNGHISCCFHGVIVDSFDCTNRVMRSAWQVEK